MDYVDMYVITIFYPNKFLLLSLKESHFICVVLCQNIYEGNNFDWFCLVLIKKSQVTDQ
jgi:hypothetical protein